VMKMFCILMVMAVLWMRACQNALIVYFKGMRCVVCTLYLNKFAKHIEKKDNRWMGERCGMQREAQEQSINTCMPYHGK